MVDHFYSRRSLHVEVYDSRTAALGVIEGDADFYLELAREAGGAALELGCGTGRLVFALARAGVEVTGLDLSTAMLEVARERLAREPEAVHQRVDLVEGDMTAFDLGREFGLVYIAFRSFMMLTTAESQRACLARAREHLAPGGLLAIDIFDPLLDRLPNGPMPETWRSLGAVWHPRTQNAVGIEVLDRANDVVSQVFEETWRFTESARDESVIRQEEEVLRMRWTYRNEMRYLLELRGFEVLAEYSDYAKSPPDYGKEQIWVARKR